MGRRIVPIITVVIFCWRILLISESMGHHDSEIMDDRSIDWDDARVVGIVAARGEETDASIVRAGPHSIERGPIRGRSAWRRAPQNRMDAGGGGGRSWAMAAAGGFGP